MVLSDIHVARNIVESDTEDATVSTEIENVNPNVHRKKRLHKKVVGLHEGINYIKVRHQSFKY